MQPARIAIIGMGLIGSSVALAARRAWPDVPLTTLDRGDALDAVAGADVVVLATPVDVIIDLLTHHAGHLGHGLVLDTGSTKRAIITAAREARLFNFVGGHPMAGAASSGPRDARTTLFDGARWFLIPTDPAGGAVGRAQAFVAALGATPVVLPDGGPEHDHVMAAVSHLPQVAASVLMKIAGDAAGKQGLQWAGNGLRDTTRLAGSSAAVWESVLVGNATELRPLLLALADDLRRIADDLENPEAVRSLFAAANRYRDMLN